MKLCMVAASLAGGGAERALLDTASLLAGRGHQVTVLTFEPEASDAYLVPPNVFRTVLGVPGHSGNRLRGIANNLRRVVRLRSAIRRLRPDVVVSYLTRANVLCLLALGGTGQPVVVTEHNVPWLNDAPAQLVWRNLRRGLYRRADQLVVVSHGLARHYGWVGKERLSVLHNLLPLVPKGEPEAFAFLPENGTRLLVGMGRLEAEKGFDRLIRAFGLVAAECPGWTLLIAGEGSRRGELTRLVGTLGLENRVLLPGRVANPDALLRRCDLFVLSSDSEGFPLALVEAMSAGLPVISFDCDFGPREIIDPGTTGLLVPPGDVPALAEAIRTLVRDGAARARLGRAGCESLRRFAPDAIIDQWERLLGRLARPAAVRP